MRKTIVIWVTVLTVVIGASGVVTADPPHEGHDAKKGSGSDNVGHGNNCDGDDSDNPRSENAESGISDNAMDNRQSGDVHCPEDETQ